MGIGQYCVSTEKQLGFVVLVMCEVALQSKSTQIVAPNVYWEHGYMGAIAPTAKKLWGLCPQVAPQEFCNISFLKQ